MDGDRSRRRFLGLAGASAAAALAGCSGLLGGEDDEETTQPPPDVSTADVPDSAVTALVEPDPEEIQAIRTELGEEISNNETSQTDAQRELQERQLELVADRIDDVESYAADTEGLTVEETIPQAGVLLLDGDPGAIRTALNDGEIDGLLSGGTFAEISQQAQGAAGPAGGAETGTGDENATAGGAGGTGNGTNATDANATDANATDANATAGGTGETGNGTNATDD